MNSVGSAAVPMAYGRSQPLAARPSAALATQRDRSGLRVARRRIQEQGTQRAQNTLRQSAHLAARAAFKARARAAQAPTPPKFEPALAAPRLLGDVNADGRLDHQDALDLLDYLFQGGARPEGLANADTNGDGNVNLADVIKLNAILRQLPQD